MDADLTTVRVRGMRGATRVARDDSGTNLNATRELLAELLERNSTSASHVVSAILLISGRVNT